MLNVWVDCKMYEVYAFFFLSIKTLLYYAVECSIYDIVLKIGFVLDNSTLFLIRTKTHKQPIISFRKIKSKNSTYRFVYNIIDMLDRTRK